MVKGTSQVILENSVNNFRNLEFICRSTGRRASQQQSAMFANDGIGGGHTQGRKRNERHDK
jgi:hypothetical protein